MSGAQIPDPQAEFPKPEPTAERVLDAARWTEEAAARFTGRYEQVDMQALRYVEHGVLTALYAADLAEKVTELLARLRALLDPTNPDPHPEDTP